MLRIIRRGKINIRIIAKHFRPQLVFCSHTQLISVLAGHVFRITTEWIKGPKGRSGIHLHSSWFRLLLFSSFPPTTRARWNFRGPKRNRVELGSSTQISGWVSVPQRSVCLSVCLLCACIVFVLPSSLITIVSPKRSVRAGCLCFLSMRCNLFENAIKSPTEGSGLVKLFEKIVYNKRRNYHYLLCFGSVFNWFKPLLVVSDPLPTARGLLLKANELLPNKILKRDVNQNGSAWPREQSSMLTNTAEL